MQQRYAHRAALTGRCAIFDKPNILLITIATAAAMVMLSLWRGDSRAFAWVPCWGPQAWHFSAYALLAFLCVQVLEAFGLSASLRVAGGFLLATSFGILMEMLQHFSIKRTPRVSDAATDAVGAALGAGLAFWLS